MGHLRQLLEAEGPDHRCINTNHYRKCSYCANIKIPCVPVPSSVQDEVIRFRHIGEVALKELIGLVSKELEGHGRRYQKGNKNLRAVFRLWVPL